MTTAFIWDKRFYAHDLGRQKYNFKDGDFLQSGLAFENPQRLEITYDLLNKTGLLNKMKAFTPYVAAEKDILRAHSKEMLNKVRKNKSVKSPVEVGEAALMAKDTYETALLSAGGAMKAIDVLYEQEDVKQSYAFIRPPGHHATYSSPMGFCIFNNVAIASEYAKAKYEVEKVFILDWDVHHGNGTQDIFYEDESVFFVSIHQDRNYPLYGGEVSEIGKGKGKGFNMNIPLIPGCGNLEYLRVIEEIVEPVIKSYKPDLILVSAGQDANLYDPLSRMMVDRDGFRMMMEKIRAMAIKHSHGKLAVFQEGGYSLPYFPLATLGVFEGLLNIKTPIVTDIEKLLPFSEFNPDIDNILNEVKSTFTNLF